MLTPTARGVRLALAFLMVSAIAALAPSKAQTPAPPKLAGTWTWTWKDRIGETHRHVLEVEGVGDKLAAREIFDDEAPVRVSKLVLENATLQFTVIRDKRKADYVGKVADADHINGTVTISSDGQAQEFPWQAERRKSAP